MRVRERRVWLATAFATAATAVALLPAAPAMAGAAAGTERATPATVTTHTGSGRPALTFIDGQSVLWAAWAGSTSTSLAPLIIGSAPIGSTTITKVGTNGNTTIPGVGPALDNDGTGVFVAWAGTDSARTLNLAYLVGGSLTCKTTFTGLTSNHSPALAHNDATGTRYLAWTDMNGHLEFTTVSSSTCSTTGTMTHSTPVIAGDTASAGPALTYDTTSTALGMVVAWAGTSSAHSLNVAVYNGSTTLADKNIIGGATAAGSDPGIASVASDLYLAYRGADGTVYTGYSEGSGLGAFSPVSTGEHASSGIGIDSDEFAYAFFDSSRALNLDL